MSELDSEGKLERFSPQHPLPEEIQKMGRDETVCRYCGVSYLIHSEIKALEKKVKSLEKELDHYKGSEERENKLKAELQILQDQRGEFEMTITVKEAAISTLNNKLKSQESLCQRLRSENDDVLERASNAEKSCKALKDRNNQLERALPRLRSTLHQQKAAIEEIHSFIEQRDTQMKEEMDVLLSHIRNTCDMEMKEKCKLQALVTDLQSRFGSTTAETEEMKQQLARQEKQILQLDKLFTENKQLQQKCAHLEAAQADLRRELDESVEKCRGLQMENLQFKDQYRSKSNEMEELAAVQRRKDMANEMTTQKLKSDLKQRETDLSSAKRELKELLSKFEEQQQLEADLTRKTSKTMKETNELKESFFKAKEEIDNLKQEREAMITSHQNRIEQLRESFKNKLAEADNWQEKLENAIQQEKERHARELQALETRLKDSFVMELEIEKGKYRELMKKYQAGSQETEEKLRAQLQSIEARYKCEIQDLTDLLAETRRKSKEMEDELRREIASLKAIIKDLEARLGRLDVGNEELVVKLKAQLRETHQELEETREVLDKQTKAGDDFQEQIKHLQETVQKECEERFELTEALSAAKEELLLLKRPIATSQSDSAGGYHGTHRQPTNLSLPMDEEPPNPGSQSTRRSLSEPQPALSNRPITSKPRTYNSGIKREYTITNNNNMVFMGEKENNGVRTVGASTKRAGGSLAENRRRIAAILGRK
ncbi:uncharacterized protein LOC127832519 isoform X2 [Dreissena polymorpha]|uniref:uncharacterized protein LOC127832519 isoform X2 n=1 Tax=Dreissena polymorpha TaxID=45954 RepID=UPI00226537F4|nr:uncharacterized protein LOC127832519 isoform X2 [Dreissena polymorpha]